MTLLHTEDYIHGMKHQKVIAEAKWFFYEITSERIDWLLDTVEQKDFAKKKVYEDI